MVHKVDVVGDVHGQLAGLRALGRHLGYDVDQGWTHNEDRTLVFVGDLVDRGEDSLGVAELVMRLVREGRAACLMGNHEYNLVGWRLGLEKPKHSNTKTIADVESRPARWAPVIDFMRTLPLALDLPALRVIHAAWHLGCFEHVEPAIRPRPAAKSGSAAIDWLRQHVALGSPFEPHFPLPTGAAVPPGDDAAHEVLIKGFEAIADQPFLDSDGKERRHVRATWWDRARAEIPSDKITVFGHYWNLPPVAGRHDAFAPPHPSGHPDLKAWQSKVVGHVPDHGVVAVPADVKFVCVDYNGVFDAKAGSCIGAYRWPEHQVAWARVPAAARTESS